MNDLTTWEVRRSVYSYLLRRFEIRFMLYVLSNEIKEITALIEGRGKAKNIK